MKYVAYHGSQKQIAERIIKTNFTINWLHCGWVGTGVYFFEENYFLANEWARYQYPRQQTRVIEVMIEVDEKNVFDLRDTNNWRLFEETRTALESASKKLNSLGLEVIDYKKDLSDGKVFDYYCKHRGILLSMLGTYTPTIEDRKKGITSKVPNATELCVKDLSIIKQKNLKIL